MMYEVDLYRQTRAEPDLKDRPKASPTDLRREMREASDGLINFGLRRQSIAAVATHCAYVMVQTARTLDELGEMPGIPDLIGGACAMVMDARDMMDKGLQIGDAPQVRAAAVVMEVTLRGILAILVGSVPYEALMETIATRKDLHALLVACSAIPMPKEPPNDTH